MKQNLYLCGFMGCGKSTIGKYLAKELKMNFYDLDRLIVENAGMPITEIFDRYGEDYFRKLESQVLVDSAKLAPAVIATGGGIFTNPKNGELIRPLGITVFLNPPFSLCYRRIKRDSRRPLAVSKTREELFTLYQTRAAAYHKYSTCSVRPGNNIRETVQMVMEKLQKYFPEEIKSDPTE